MRILTTLPAALALAGLIAAHGSAQTPNPDALNFSGSADSPNPGALDFARIDLATLELAAGVISALDGQGPVLGLRAEATLASLDMLGLAAELLQLEAAARDAFESGLIAGKLLDVDAWMIGSGSLDSSPCPWWPGKLCDDTSGYVGFGFSLIGFVHDLELDRTALRIGELELLASVTPAFAASWSKYRLLPRAGASLDYLGRMTGQSATWIGRLAVGADARALLGPVDLQAMFRFRPSFADLDDYGLEVWLDANLRRTWQGLDRAGDALRISLQLGYAYWRVPGHAYGSDWLPTSKHTLFARLVFAPSLSSAVPPAF